MHTYEICYKSKKQRLSFPVSITSSSKPFQLLHLDTWGPYKEPTLDGAHYVFTIVDDFSRATWTFLMKTKTQAFILFVHLHNLIQNQFNTTIKSIRTENGSEFTNKIFHDYLSEKGIIYQRNLQLYSSAKWTCREKT